MRTTQELIESGFTGSGQERFEKTVQDYSTELFIKSTALGNADKPTDGDVEITHDHVRSAAIKIMAKTDSPTNPLKILFQIGEYICAIAAGVGGSNLSKDWGILVFGSGLTIGVLLFLARNFREYSK